MISFLSFVSQPRRFVAQNDKEIEGLDACSEFARNLLGVCLEFAWNLDFARNLLGIRSENGPDQPCAELSTWKLRKKVEIDRNRFRLPGSLPLKGPNLEKHQSRLKFSVSLKLQSLP